MDPEKAEYSTFLEKVNRTVYLDNLSPEVTDSVVKTALNQFGNVENVQFIQNYTETRSIPRCALVEMRTSKQAELIVEEIKGKPFMIRGMPRPIRARAAEKEMFEDRPREPGRRMTCEWLEPQDARFEVAKKLKHLAAKHEAEASFLLKYQLVEEGKLAAQQEENLKANFKKFETIDGVLADESAKRLARHFDMKSFRD